MKRTLTFILGAALLTSAACSRSGDTLRRDQQNYEVIQEGSSASGVSSTISAPGETPPPLPELTGTNADTTTAFNIPNTTMPTAPGQPGTIAGTLPQPDSYPRTPRPRPVAPQTTPTTTIEPEPQPPAATDTTSTAPAEDEKPPENPPATTTTT